MPIQIQAILQHWGPRALNLKGFPASSHPAEHIMRCFWHHTKRVARTKQISFELLAALDKALRSLSELSSNCDWCLSFWKSMSKEVYHEGWLADKAVAEGVSEVLSLRIGRSNEAGLEIEMLQKPPLEKALIYMRSHGRLTTINNLLRRGADPNESGLARRTIW